MDESVQRVESIQELCIKNNKEMVVYLSMGFGNPYGDVYNEEILLKWAGEMVQRHHRLDALLPQIAQDIAVMPDLAGIELAG